MTPVRGTGDICLLRRLPAWRGRRHQLPSAFPRSPGIIPAVFSSDLSALRTTAVLSRNAVNILLIADHVGRFLPKIAHRLAGGARGVFWAKNERLLASSLRRRPSLSRGRERPVILGGARNPIGLTRRFPGCESSAGFFAPTEMTRGRNRFRRHLRCHWRTRSLFSVR